jgi:hypothetical protein
MFEPHRPYLILSHVAPLVALGGGCGGSTGLRLNPIIEQSCSALPSSLS